MSNKNQTRSVLINPIIARSKDEVHRSATPLELFNLYLESIAPYCEYPMNLHLSKIQKLVA